MALQTSSRGTRIVNYAALNEVVLLGGLAVLLWIKWLRGQLDFYIHPRYTALVLVSALILLLMAGVRLRGVLAERPVRPMGWIYLLLALPLLLGTLVPAQPLGAGTLASRGLSPASSMPASGRQPSVQDDSTGWSLLDWAVLLSTHGPELEGRPVDVVGFVFQDETLGADQFYVARYVVTCCAADGVSVGFPVLWEGGAALPGDDWVRVQGTMSTTMVGGIEQPAILAADVAPVAQPQDPYLYP